MNEYSHIIVAALSGFGGICGAAFWFKKWVSGVDSSLKELHGIVNKLNLSVELSQADKNRTDGFMQQVQVAINQTNSSLGQTTAKIDALWRVLDKYFEPEVKDRTSDVLTKLNKDFK